MITTIRLTDKDIKDKEEIERSLQGASLTHHTIYRRGLDEIMDKNKNEE